MSDINPTRRTDEPPSQDDVTLAGWPVTITAEEATALQTALKQLQTALDAVVRERDEARAEVERLRAERDTLLLDAREFAQWFSYHFGHVDKAAISPWRALNERLQAHADTLAAIDEEIAKIDKEGGR